MKFYEEFVEYSAVFDGITDVQLRFLNTKFHAITIKISFSRTRRLYFFEHKQMAYIMI